MNIRTALAAEEPPNNDERPIMMGLASSMESTYGWVRPSPKRQLPDRVIVEGNMVLAPQYAENENGITIIGWGLIPAVNAVRPKDEQAK